MSFQPIVSAILKGHLYGDGQYDVPEGNASTSNVNTVLRVRVTDVEDISELSD